MTHPYHRHHHPDASFPHAQQSQQQPLLPAPAAKAHIIPKPQKAKRRRKRHPPVGPAGAWFQARSSVAGVPSHSGSHDNNNNNNNGPQDDDETNGAQQRSSTTSSVNLMSNPAWMAMQCSLQWVTPDVVLSSSSSNKNNNNSHSFLTIAQRYKRLRPHVPREYTLLPQIIHQQSNIWKLPKHQKLVVTVQSVSCHHDDIWTVELLDDTGSTIQAWVQPFFVQTEKEQQADGGASAGGPQYIRPGYVWCLENVTMMLQQTLMNNTEVMDGGGGETNTTLERMLLISQRNVVQVWTPNSLQAIDERVFVRWMEQRTAFQSQWEEEEQRQQQQCANDNNNDDNNNNNSDGQECHHSRNGGSNNNNNNSHHYRGDAAATCIIGGGNNHGDDGEEEEEVDEEEDRYRRQQQQQFSSSRNSKKSSAFPAEEQDEENMGVVGDPKILSLHTNSSSRTPPPPFRATMPFRMSQQQPHQSHSQSTSLPSSCRPPVHPAQSQQASQEELLDEQDERTTTMLMETFMNQSQQSSTVHTPQNRQQIHNSHPKAPPPSRKLVNAQNMEVDDQAFADSNSRFLPPISHSQRPRQNSQLPIGLQQQGQPACFDNQKRHRRGGGGDRSVTSHHHGSRRVSLSQKAAVPSSSLTQPPPPHPPSSRPERDTLSHHQHDKENRRKIHPPPQQQVVDVEQTTKHQARPRKKVSVDLSKFSAITATSRQPQPSSSNHAESAVEDITAKEGKATAQETRTPIKQQSKNDDKKKRKKKKPKYDASPLSQSPKPALGKLWTSTALFDGPDLMGLSSDEEGEDREKTMAQQTLAKPNSVEVESVGKSAARNDVATTNAATNARGSAFGGGFTSSIFQATNIAGMEWMNLSDEDDD